MPGSSSANENMLFLILEETSLYHFPFARASVISEIIFQERDISRRNQVWSFSHPASQSFDVMRTGDSADCPRWLIRFRRKSHLLLSITTRMLAFINAHITMCNYLYLVMIILYNSLSYSTWISCYEYVHWEDNHFYFAKFFFNSLLLGF